MANTIKYGPAVGPAGPVGPQGLPGVAVTGGRAFYLRAYAVTESTTPVDVTLPHASSSAAAGTRFSMPNGSGIVLAPATDASQSPLGECVYARYHEGVDAPWSAEL